MLIAGFADYYLFFLGSFGSTMSTSIGSSVGNNPIDLEIA